MSHFTLPDLGEGLQEAEVVEWHVTEGEGVTHDQLLVSVETAKAIVDIPAPYDAEIEKLLVAEGELVHTGEPLLSFAGSDSDGSQTVVGTLAQEDDGTTQDDFVIGAVPAASPAVSITPALRELAKQQQVPLDSLHGSGRGGSITRADIDAAAGPSQQIAGQRLSGVARSMAKNIARAGEEVVAASLFDQVSIAHWPEISDLMVRLIDAIVAGCRAEPRANAWYHGDSLSLQLCEQIDLGIAVDTPDGLFVPVMRDVANRDAADIRHGLDQLRQAVEQRRIPASELRGATLSLSNFGPLGGRFATPIVVPPQVMIVGVGRAFKEPAMHEGKLVEDTLLPLSLSFDHRALNGGQAARFLAALLARLRAS